MSSDATASTAVSPCPPIPLLSKNGAGTIEKPDPFQCIVSASLCATSLGGHVSQSPTNQTSFGPTISMSSMKLPEPPPEIGAGTTLQAEPSQCSTRRCVPTKPSGAWILWLPAAHTSSGP